MRRFYKDVSVADGAILLDGRPVRTAARAPLILPGAALAEAVAGEWRAQGDMIDPATMPLTGLANAAIDRASPDLAATLARYAENDLVCYRAEGPATLVARQAGAWDPLIAWAQRRYDVRFNIATGIVHLAQPPATIARLGEAVAARGPFALAGLSPLVTIAGSLVIALAVAERASDAEAAFIAAMLDEDWQAERWGTDTLAAQARANRRRDFLSAARFLALCDAAPARSEALD